MDVETVHEICQNCGILLVEASSASIEDLMQAVDQAVSQGATVASNSYGGAELSDETKLDGHFDKSGVAFTVSSGDGGYGVSYPAASPYVTAVGGTSLTLDKSGKWASEQVWNGSGSGCSRYEAKPAFQKDKSCSRRMVADVAADADPATGAAVYSSQKYQGHNGWFVLGGTSLSAPLVAGIYGLAGSSFRPSNASIYAHGVSLHDITIGENGNCRTSYYCQAVTGYDGPTGLGSPKGVKAF